MLPYIEPVAARTLDTQNTNPDLGQVLSLTQMLLEELLQRSLILEEEWAALAAADKEALKREEHRE